MITFQRAKAQFRIQGKKRFRVIMLCLLPNIHILSCCAAVAFQMIEGSSHHDIDLCKIKNIFDIMCTEADPGFTPKCFLNIKYLVSEFITLLLLQIRYVENSF